LTHSPDSHRNMDRNWRRLILDIPCKVGTPGAHRQNFDLVQTFWCRTLYLLRIEINLGFQKRLLMKHKVMKYFWKTEDDHSQSVCEEYEDILCTMAKFHLNIYYLQYYISIRISVKEIIHYGGGLTWHTIYNIKLLCNMFLK